MSSRSGVRETAWLAGQRAERGLRVPAAGTAVRDAEAEQLLAAVAALRRTMRRLSGRPALLATLTGAQQELVVLVARRPGLSVAEAADELALAPNTVSTLVRRLTDAGVMRRSADPVDRRVARLTLEPATGREVDAWRDRRVETLGSALRRLPPRDRQLLAGAAAAIGRLADALQSPDEAPG